MTSRRKSVTFPFPLPKLEVRLGAALRKAIAKGYGKAELKNDVLAGIVVGVVALPLAMALAIASGVPPQHGLYTAIVAGAIIAVVGGSKTQVSGPTAAFVVILAPIAAKFGIGGLCVATVMAGAILVALGLARLGQLLQYVPHSVTTGFTAGIAVVIATLQVKDLFGLHIEAMPEHYVERVEALGAALPTVNWPDLVLGVFTFTLLLAWPRVTRRVPAPLVALALAALAGVALTTMFDGTFEYATIGSRFSYVADGATHAGIPQQPPWPVLPWSLPGPHGEPLGFSFALIRALAPSAIAIAMLGAIESLLSATVADGMAGTKHDPNAELVAQGIGNVVAPFFGGFAATGAIARTATNVRAGARSPIAAIVHSAFVLLAVLVLAPLLSWLPMASLAALLMLVAWNMSEAKHFVHTLRVAPRSDVLVLLTCFTLTVLFDMTVSVTFGVLLAALLFMRRMAELTGAKLREGRHEELDLDLPPGVVVYEIGGPLFFGAAQKAMSALDETARTARVVIFDLEDVPAMDGTGLVAFESALARLAKHHTLVFLVGVRDQPRHVLENAGITASAGKIEHAATVREAVDAARAFVAVAPAKAA